jgi:hypothetical protein
MRGAGRDDEDAEHRDKLARLRRLRELAVAKGQNERVAAIDELTRKEQDKHARRRAQAAEKETRRDERAADKGSRRDETPREQGGGGQGRGQGGGQGRGGDK